MLDTWEFEFIRGKIGICKNGKLQNEVSRKKQNQWDMLSQQEFIDFVAISGEGDKLG